MAIVLYGFVRGDTLGLVVIAPESERVDDLAQRLNRAAAPRVQLSGDLTVLHRGKALRGELTLLEAGLTSLERVDLTTRRDLA
jgi:predicted metal-dependent phosphotriesterase family hydrolase